MFLHTARGWITVGRRRNGWQEENEMVVVEVMVTGRPVAARCLVFNLDSAKNEK